MIANGMVYVSSSDGTISAWAPLPSQKRRKKAVNKDSNDPRTRLLNSRRQGGGYDLRSSPNALANFGLSDR